MMWTLGDTSGVELPNTPTHEPLRLQGTKEGDLRELVVAAVLAGAALDSGAKEENEEST